LMKMIEEVVSARIARMFGLPLQILSVSIHKIILFNVPTYLPTPLPLQESPPTLNIVVDFLCTLTH
jgi:hypothetical protein